LPENSDRVLTSAKNYLKLGKLKKPLIRS